MKTNPIKTLGIFIVHFIRLMESGAQDLESETIKICSMNARILRQEEAITWITNSMSYDEEVTEGKPKHNIGLCNEKNHAGHLLQVDFDEVVAWKPA